MLAPWKKNNDKPRQCIKKQRHHFADKGQYNQSYDLSSSQGFPDSSVGKESTCNAGDLGSILGLGRSPGEGNGNPLQYSCLENPMDGWTW